MKFLPFLFLSFLLFGVLSCGSSRKLVKAADAEAETVFQQIESERLQFVDLTIQSRIKADLEDVTTSMNGKIFIKNHHKIWVNISKFGLTAARAQITPEGFQVYEKLGKTYGDGDFSFFNRLLRVDFIDYEKLQSLLLGRIFVDISPKEFVLSVEDNQYKITHRDNERISAHPKKGQYLQEYVFDSRFRLIRAHLTDPIREMDVQIDYEGWRKFGVQDFPGNVKILVKDTKTQKIELEYNSFAFVESPTPFSIPSGYKPNKMFQ